MAKIFKIIVRHKILTFIMIVALGAGGYYGYNKLTSGGTVVRYVMAQAKKDVLITTLSGSGQVAASNQVDIKPKASGEIIALNVKVGQAVKTGDSIARLDTTDVEKAVRDAQANLDSANLSLEKLQQPADALSIIQSENSLAQAQQSKRQAEDNLARTYNDGFNTVVSTFLDLPNTMSGLQGILFNSDFRSGQRNLDYYADAVKGIDDAVLKYRDDAFNNYQTAKQKYDQNFQDYRTASVYSDTDVIDALVNETYTTTKSIAQAIKSANNLINFYSDKIVYQPNTKVPALVTTHLATLNTYTSQTSSHLQALFNAVNAIKDDLTAVDDADRSIDEKTQSLAKLKAGADPLDVQSQMLAIKQRQNALADAKANLANYNVRAPFDGIIVAVNVEKGDSGSSGTAIATLITRQKIAEISLNEVDAAKVKAGQKASVTFDAIPDLTISGQVSGVDFIGTVTQGVVIYNVKIAFDTQDSRVKPGMSTSVSIIIDAQTNALVIPAAAVKYQGGAGYVEMPDETVDAAAATSNSGVTLMMPIRRQTVETGSSNDTETEITSGLKEGDLVILKTISSAIKSTPVPTTRNNGGGGGGFRIPGL